MSKQWFGVVMGGYIGHSHRPHYKNVGNAIFNAWSAFASATIF
jgi:hypothetical protein